MPVWLIEILGKSPVLAGIGIAAFFLHKIVKELLDAPDSLALIVGIFAGKGGREFILDWQDRRRQAEPSGILEAPNQRPPRWWRRKRRRRRR